MLSSSHTTHTERITRASNVLIRVHGASFLLLARFDDGTLLNWMMVH